MSTKRAVRRHHRQRVAAKRRRFVQNHLNPWSAEHFSSWSDNQLATRHPLDCGSHCLLCHGAKFLEPRRAREKRQWQATL